MSIWTIVLLGAALLTLGLVVDFLRKRREANLKEEAPPERTFLNQDPLMPYSQPRNCLSEASESFERSEEDFHEEGPQCTPKKSTRSSTIVAVSVMAQQGNFGRFDVEPGFGGSTLLRVLQTLQLSYGQFNIFHRHSAFGGPLFSVASVTEPGDFQIAEMPMNYYAGVLFFMKLPLNSNTPAIDAFNAMIEAATRMATSLGGQLCDQQGRPLSNQVVERLRDLVVSLSPESVERV